MTKEQELFLSVLKDNIAEQKTDAPECIGYNSVIRFANNHQLQGIVYYQCKEIFKEHSDFSFYALQLRSSYLQNIYFMKTRQHLLGQVKDELKKNKVNFFIIKGELLAQYYPQPEFRTMGDTDIVVDDREKANEVLLSLDFVNIGKTPDREWQYKKNGFEFELHDRLVYEEAINLDSTTEFLNSFKEYVVNGKIDDSFHFIFVLNHLRKHFMNSGVGFRQFLDVAVMVKNDDKIDWKWTEGKLKEIGLLPFAKTVFFFIDRWFDVVAPIASVEVPEDVFESSTAYIFDNGVFGFDNEDNKDFLASNTVREAKCPKFAMVATALKKVFPSYRTLIASKHYAFLIGKPYFLPVAWIHRLFRGVSKKGFSEGKKQISKSFISTEYIAKREEMFRNWGLSK